MARRLLNFYILLKAGQILLFLKNVVQYSQRAVFFRVKIFYEQKNEPIWLSNQKKLGQRPHLHKALELVFVEKGSATAHADGFCGDITSGDIFIAFPNQVHYYEGSEQGRYCVLCLSPKLFFGQKELLYSCAPVTNIAKITPEIKKLLQSFIKIHPSDLLSESGYLSIILSSLLKTLTLSPNTRQDNGTIREVLDWCENHFTEEISLASVAEGTHLSRCYVSHLFSQKLGMGFSDYINLLRINAACELLCDTDKKISDVSGDVGYSTIRSFNRSFSKIMEMTPQSYREAFSLR